MERMTGGQAIVAQLEREGVDVAFGIPACTRSNSTTRSWTAASTT
jgi:glyoxylate carboligase